MSKNKLLKEYFQHLSLQENNINEGVANQLGKAAKFLGKEGISGTRQALHFSLMIIPGATLAFRSAQYAFSSARRKCGGMIRKGPGYKTCVMREKISALNKQLSIYNNVLAKCSQSNNPDFCKQQGEMKAETIKSKIYELQEKLKDATTQVQSESVELSEQGGAILSKLGGIGAGLSGFLMMLFAGVLVDKAIFYAWRGTFGLLSKSIRRCGVFKRGPEREICMSKGRLEMYMKQMGILRNVASSCSKQRHPDKCQNTVREKIESLNRKIKIEQDNITSYKNEVAQAKKV